MATTWYSDGNIKCYNGGSTMYGVYIYGGDPEQDWVDAIDLIENHMEYTETDIPIPLQEIMEGYAEIGKILLGVEE